MSTNPDIDLTATWHIGDVAVDGRVCLAPMAGVSIQAFRRQGRRFGASLVCTEMVSSAGIHHDNKRTKGYMSIAADEHPLALQLFGSDPGYMAEAAHQVAAAGADIIDINMGCPVKKVVRTASGCAMLEDHDLAVAVAKAVVDATDLPVSVKLRRGMKDGSRACLELGPRLAEEAGVAAITLHPRSAQQMYTGRADHDLTRELVELIDVPVIASGDITSRSEAQAVLAMTGAKSVMIARAAQGNPWLLHDMVHGDSSDPGQDEKIVELIRFMREVIDEMGEQRATGFLRKFYGWYLKGSGFTRAIRNDIVRLGEPAEVERRLLEQFPAAAELLAEVEPTWTLPDRSLDRDVDMPVSLFAGG